MARLLVKHYKGYKRDEDEPVHVSAHFAISLLLSKLTPYPNGETGDYFAEGHGRKLSDALIRYMEPGDASKPKKAKKAKKASRAKKPCGVTVKGIQMVRRANGRCGIPK